MSGPTGAEVVAHDQDAGPSQPAELIDLVAEAVRAVPGVADLHAGVLGEVATYLPGRRVNGVRLREPGCEVHVVLEWVSSISEVTDLVRGAVRPFVDGPVDVTVEDVLAPDAEPPPGHPG